METMLFEQDTVAIIAREQTSGMRAVFAPRNKTNEHLFGLDWKTVVLAFIENLGAVIVISSASGNAVHTQERPKNVSMKQ